VDKFTVSPKLTEASQRQITAEYTQNLDKYIRDFAEREIGEIRQAVSARAMTGQRAEGLAKIPAISLWRITPQGQILGQAGNLADDVKIPANPLQGNWHHAIPAGARPATKRCATITKSLKAKSFRGDSPPVTNQKTGARNHPGEDYNWQLCG